MGLKTWWTGRKRLTQAATTLPYTTPPPTLDEYGDTDGPPQGVFAIFEPSPDHVNYVFQHSDEWARVVVRLRTETYRRGVTIIPTNPFWCQDCATPADDEAAACPNCGSQGAMRPPDDAQKTILEKWLRQANQQRETLIEVAERRLEEGLKHGRAVAVFQYDYTLDDTGRIAGMKLTQIRAADPGRVLKLKDPTGRPGGIFVCLSCRGQKGYTPQPSPAQGCPSCGSVVYEAHWVESTTYSNATYQKYWLRDEVHESRWPYKDGSSPAARLWNKLVYLLWDDRYAAQAVDPRVPQRPDKIFVTIGGDEGRVAAWAKRDAEDRKRNRYKMSHLHLPHPPGGLGEFKMDAKVLDLGDVEFRLKDLERRKLFEQSIRNHYHVSPVQSGDVEASGGLNQEGLQLRSTGQVVEDLQRLEQAGWLAALAAAANVTEWMYSFQHPLEEDGGRKADEVQKHLTNARSAKDLGLMVEWRDNRAVIQDGQVEAPLQSPLAGNPFTAPREKPPGAVPPINLGQAVSSSEGFGENINAVFRGPAGSVAAQDALWLSFNGVSPELGARIRTEIVESLTQPQGWSVDSIVRRIKPFLAQAGLDNPEARARTIARTETRSIGSVWKERLFRQAEQERGRLGSYRMRGAKDFRRTKLSWWIDEQVGAGKPLNEVVAIMDQGVELAKAGAFAEGGSHSGTRGQFIKLPGGFNRRGFLTHYQDRDEVVEVV